jgi:hypothetical protein
VASSRQEDQMSRRSINGWAKRKPAVSGSSRASLLATVWIEMLFGPR